MKKYKPDYIIKCKKCKRISVIYMGGIDFDYLLDECTHSHKAFQRYASVESFLARDSMRKVIWAKVQS